MTTSFAITWNTAFEGIPADTENINLGAGRIRDTKVAIHQRLGVDHSWVGDGNDGKHNQVSLRLASADPVLDTTDGALYTKAVNTNTELFFEDSAARVLQLTNLGALNTPAPFPSGTQLVFVQSTAPPGWVQNTAANDRMLRWVGDNTGGSLGGSSWSISGLVASTVVAGHQLSAAELPSHTHQVNAVTSIGGNVAFGNASPFVSLAQLSITSDGGAVGNAAHVHGATTTVFGDGTWRTPYVNVLFGIKS